MNPENDNESDESGIQKKNLILEKPQPKLNISKKVSFTEKFSLDYIFSYDTNKELNVLDRFKITHSPKNHQYT